MRPVRLDREGRLAGAQAEVEFGAQPKTTFAAPDGLGEAAGFPSASSIMIRR